MFQYVSAAVFVPTTFVALQHSSTSIRLEPGWVAAMTTIVLAQLCVVHLRTNWEKGRVAIQSSPSE